MSIYIYIHVFFFFVRHYLIAAANPEVSNHYGWPFRPRSVVVDPLKMHVKTLEPPLAGSCCGGPLRKGPWLWAGPWLRAGPWPLQAGPGPPYSGSPLH